MTTKYIHPETVKMNYDVYVERVRKEASEMGLPTTHEFYHFRKLGAKEFMDEILKVNELLYHD